MIPATVATSSVAEQQHFSGKRIVVPDVIFPVKTQIITHKLSSVATLSKGEVTNVLIQIINTMWNNHSISKTLKIMVESIYLFMCEQMSIAIKVSDQLLLFGI
jgi:hypothetical protein